MELPPTDFEFPTNAVSLRKISVIEHNVEAIQVVYYQRFSIIERKEAKLMSVPELVPEKQGNLDSQSAKENHHHHEPICGPCAHCNC
jgi:hypothetical protein